MKVLFSYVLFLLYTAFIMLLSKSSVGNRWWGIEGVEAKLHTLLGTLLRSHCRSNLLYIVIPLGEEVWWALEKFCM